MINSDVAKNIEKHRLNRISWRGFLQKVKQNYAVFFLYFFFLWVVYGLYKFILSHLGVYGLIATLGNSATIIFVLILFSLPVLYLSFVLSIYLLKKMYYPSLRVKGYFYLGLKLFILDILFVFIIIYVGYLFLMYDSTIVLVLLFLVLLLMLFFIFVSYKTVFTGNFAQSFLSIFKQLWNIRAIGFFLLTGLILGMAFLITYGLVYLGILPTEIYMLLYPFMMLVVFYMTYYSVRV